MYITGIATDSLDLATLFLLQPMATMVIEIWEELAVLQWVQRY